MASTERVLAASIPNHPYARMGFELKGDAAERARVLGLSKEIRDRLGLTEIIGPSDSSPILVIGGMSDESLNEFHAFLQSIDAIAEDGIWLADTRGQNTTQVEKSEEIPTA